jgi:hypothetical protein
MWIPKYVRGSFHDTFDVQCELDQVIQDDVFT